MEKLIASALCSFARLLTGVQALWQEDMSAPRQRVYFANHRSHGDFVLIWASLPPYLRARTRPVAGADYWLTGGLRQYFATKVFRSVLVDRSSASFSSNPLKQMTEALAGGDSLIIFPEGTRNLGEGLQAFKRGIFHLANAHPAVDFVPVWIENLGRVMPKGTLIPVPLLCSLRFGKALHLAPGEDKEAFLERARKALLDLAPPAD